MRKDVKNHIPSKKKLEVASARYNEILRWTVPTNSLISDWIPIIGIDGDIPGNSIFEYVYRSYHQSFKVSYMQSSVSNFKNMIVYLFCKRVDSRFLLRKKFDNLIGFPNPIEGIKLEDVFYKDSLSYKYVKDVEACKPANSDGWQLWEDSHLTLMGGVYWSLMASISLLGMLQHYNREDYKQQRFMSYPDGVTNYVLSSINYEGLNK